MPNIDPIEMTRTQLEGEYYTTPDIEELLSISRTHLRKLRKVSEETGSWECPPFFKLSNRVYYPKDEYREWAREMVESGQWRYVEDVEKPVESSVE